MGWAMRRCAGRSTRGAGWACRSRACPAPCGGRVLVCEYDVTLFEGAARVESGGLVDVWDVPAWDLWIGLSPTNAIPLGGRDRVAESLPRPGQKGLHRLRSHLQSSRDLRDGEAVDVLPFQNVRYSASRFLRIHGSRFHDNRSESTKIWSFSACKHQQAIFLRGSC